MRSRRAGEVIGKILNDPSKPASRFEGYADKPRPRRRSCATSSEGRRLVPHRRPDAQGRATAISTSSTASATPSAGRARTSPPPEVAEAIGRVPGVKEANVYGVRCRAATAAPAWRRSSPRTISTWRRCATICVEPSCPSMRGRVPAHPRRRSTSPRTFKQKKVDLVSEGFDPRPRRPDLLQRSRSARRSCASTPPLYERIRAGGVRL